MDGVELVAVAAVAENGVIGAGSSVPWNLPEDRRQYRERVADSPVVVGRRTFEWMRGADEPLPGSAQVVLSRSERSYPESSVRVVDGVEAATDALAALGADRGYVLGGEDIYELFQPRLDGMVLSRVHREPEGDAQYPEFDRSAWRLVRETDHDGFTVEHWRRRGTEPDVASAAPAEERGDGDGDQPGDHDDGGDQQRE